jgi:hypothetical protein
MIFFDDKLMKYINFRLLSQSEKLIIFIYNQNNKT